MGLQRRHCGRCGYDHYQDDELWFSLDELIEVVRLIVQQELAAPDQRLPAAERDQIRAQLAARRAEQGPASVATADRAPRGQPASPSRER